MPRSPSEIVGGTGFDVLEGKARVMSVEGEDRTQAFLDGAQRTLERMKKLGIGEAVLKAKSPSCGVSRIFDGSFSGTLREGPGVTAALLIRNGICVREE